MDELMEEHFKRAEAALEEEAGTDEAIHLLGVLKDVVELDADEEVRGLRALVSSALEEYAEAPTWCAVQEYGVSHNPPMPAEYCENIAVAGEEFCEKHL